MVTWRDEVAQLTHSYRYDVHGRRIAKVVASVGPSDETRYIYSAFQIIQERDGAGTIDASFIPGSGIDDILVMDRGTERYYLHSDDQNNVVAVTRDTGSGIEGAERNAYQDYGALLDGDSFLPKTSSSVGNPSLFAGRWKDVETGLYEFRNRYLEPILGRFTSRDPIGIWGDEVNLGNGYTYVGNNPWSRIDPLGLGWFSKALDAIQTGLDVVGMLPGAGNVADAVNAGISLARGDVEGAAERALSAVPVVGQVATAKRAVRGGVEVLGATQKLKQSAKATASAMGNASGTRRSATGAQRMTAGNKNQNRTRAARAPAPDRLPSRSGLNTNKSGTTGSSQAANADSSSGQRGLGTARQSGKRSQDSSQAPPPRNGIRLQFGAVERGWRGGGGAG